MSELEEKAVDILDKLERLTEQYAPEVADAALQAVRISAASELVYAVVGIVCVFIAVRAGRKLINFLKNKDEEEPFECWDLGLGVSCIVVISSCTVIAVASIWSLFDLWVWVALFSPDLALAHKITGL